MSVVPIHLVRAPSQSPEGEALPGFVPPAALREEILSGEEGQHRTRAGRFLENRFDNAGQAGQSGWLLRENPGSVRDATLDFAHFYERAAKGDSIMPKDFKDGYVFAFVKGLYGNDYPAYFKKALKFCKAQGLDARILTVNTAAPSATNVAAVKDGVEALAKETGKKVVLLGHSMGGANVYDAVRENPDLQRLVGGVATLQGALGGTPATGFIERERPLRAFFNWFTRRVGGEPEALKEIEYSGRRAALETAPMPASMPVVSMGSYARRNFSVLSLAASFFRRVLGVHTDGLAPAQDAIAPNSAGIVVRGADHASFSVPYLSPFGDAKAGPAIAAQLRVLYGEIQKKAAEGQSQLDQVG